MLRRTALILAAMLALAACGSTKSEGLGNKTVSGWDAVSISGDVGKAPKVDWKGQMSPVTTTETKTLVPGTGAKIASDDTICSFVWIGNGYSKAQAYSDFDAMSPEGITNDSNLSPFLQKMLDGATLGSRVASLASGSDVFGSTGQPSLGVSNDDPLLVLADWVAKVPDKPQDVGAAKLPKLLPGANAAKPTGMNFKGVAKPEVCGDLLRTTLKQGTGKTVTSDMTVNVNYLGEVYQGKKPFDESFTKKPVSFQLSQVVKGWSIGLTGVKVGSRVLLQIPPLLGYGSQAQSGIPANSTLYFVVDVLSATKTAPTATASPTAAPTETPAAPTASPAQTASPTAQ